MPRLSDNEIKTWIAEGRVFAISIDTAVFDSKQKTFRSAVLRRLDQFHKRNIRILFVDLIAEEMKAHLRDDAAETQRALRTALVAHTNRWGRKAPEGEEAALLLNADAAGFAQAEFDDFLNHVHGEVISIEEAPELAQQVFGLYFSQNPPFGTTAKRKSEFPDAFALRCLDIIAYEQGQVIICVSADSGWIEYAEKSMNLVCVGQLEHALSLFNDADQHLADAIVEKWRQGKGGEYIQDVFRAFEYRLDDLDFGIEGQAIVSFEAEPLSAALQYVNPQGIGQPTVIAVDAETVTFSVQVEATIEFGALFNFYVTDSVDKDYVSLGSEEAYVEVTLPFDLTITADRILQDDPVFIEVEVTKRRIEVDFGHVEAFPNEDPTHEKY